VATAVTEAHRQLAAAASLMLVVAAALPKELEAPEERVEVRRELAAV
jgi:hypothetical protein